MLISFVWLYMFKGDVYAQILDKTQKYFWVFYLFLKVILYFRAFSFCSKCIFVFFFKNWFRGCFVRSSRLRASCKKCLREMIFWQFTQKLSQLSHDYIATNSFLRNAVWLKLDFSKFRQKLSLLSRDLKLLAKVFMHQRSLSQLPRDCVTTA